MKVAIEAALAKDALGYAIQRLEALEKGCERPIPFGAAWARGEIGRMQEALADIRRQEQPCETK